MTRRVDQIMSEVNEIKDQAVAVHLARMEGEMKAMRVSHDALGKQLEGAISELREVTKATQRYSSHDDSIKRIWQAIEERDRKWDERAEDLGTKQQSNADKVNRIFWFSSGVTSVGVALLAIIVWVLQGEMSKNSRDDQRLDGIELHLAADQIRPYRPK